MMIGKVSEYLTGAVTKLVAKDLKALVGQQWKVLCSFQHKKYFLGAEQYAKVAGSAEEVPYELMLTAMLQLLTS